MNDTTLATPTERMHGADSVRALINAACLVATCALPLGCRRADPGPDLQIVGESTRVRREDPVPRATPWLVEGRMQLVAALGETLGLQIRHRTPGSVSLTIAAAAGVAVRTYTVESYAVTRASTDLYCGGRGGSYADGLSPATAPSSDPAYVEVSVPTAAIPGTYTGELVVGAQTLPVSLTIARVVLPPLATGRVWAYEDPRELAWAASTPPDPANVSSSERACIDTFRSYGVLLSPDLHLDWFGPRKELLAGVRDLPVVIPTDPATVGDAVRAWIDKTRGTGMVPFAIPIDEPSTPEAREKVIALARAVRAAGGGPATFRFAVTDDPRPEYGDLIDLYISLRTRRDAGGAQWTYNGAPPRAGSVVLDAATPGTRTWGWIGYRWSIPTWYVWDALYWHDRHNRKSDPMERRALDVRVDPTSFDGGEDHGNLDGVLALPLASGGCQPTLRLAALRRGLQDRQLIELAAACNADATNAVVDRLVPTALGDAPPKGDPAWPTDEAAWEAARRKLLQLADCKS
ncbi:hypothetical protein BH11MYX3_BH11MYX3_14160 [soil metagenome]